MPVLWKLLNPLRGWIAFTFFSHKILRWLCPFFLLAMLVCNAALLSQPLYRICMYGQLGFYAISLLGGVTPAAVRAPKLLRVGAMFVGMNAALFVGFWRWLFGTQKGAWRRTAHTQEAEVAVP